MAEVMVMCSRCRDDLPESAFHRNASRPNGLQNQCKSCRAVKDRVAGTDKDPRRTAGGRWGEPGYRAEYFRRWHLNKTYGLTEDDYDSMLSAQGGVCAICKKAETDFDARAGRVRHFHVDHCHVTGEIRGLLCGRCNTTLGKVGDDVTLLQAMIGYLKAPALVFQDITE